MDNTIWDPLRRKWVALTPEEQVRQWFIQFLTDVVRVPAGLMNSEVSFSLGPKRFRADILLYDRSAGVLAVVECKRPDVALDATVLDQAVRYNMALNVPYIIITNGTTTCICRRETDEKEGQSEVGTGGNESRSECGTSVKKGGETVRYKFMSYVPTYDEMTGRKK